jgi:hypothetical protein
VRLGSPVSPSCRARWASSSSALLRSEMSRETQTISRASPPGVRTARRVVSSQTIEPSRRRAR